MSDQPAPHPTAAPRLTRRHALGGAAGVGIGLPLLAACGSDGGSTATDAGTTGSGGTGGSASADAPAGPFATTADVPVGSGAVFTDVGVVVTQPTEGEFHGFSITCTHQGCPVSAVTADGISCPCHGSVFDLTTGAPTAGPASSPLGGIELDVQGQDISRA
jgi:Rieske Fe-S protein